MRKAAEFAKIVPRRDDANVCSRRKLPRIGARTDGSADAFKFGLVKAGIQTNSFPKKPDVSSFRTERCKARPGEIAPAGCQRPGSTGNGRIWARGEPGCGAVRRGWSKRAWPTTSAGRSAYPRNRTTRQVSGSRTGANWSTSQPLATGGMAIPEVSGFGLGSKLRAALGLLSARSRRIPPAAPAAAPRPIPLRPPPPAVHWAVPGRTPLLSPFGREKGLAFPEVRR